MSSLRAAVEEREASGDAASRANYEESELAKVAVKEVETQLEEARKALEEAYKSAEQAREAMHDLQARCDEAQRGRTEVGKALDESCAALSAKIQELAVAHSHIEVLEEKGRAGQQSDGAAEAELIQVSAPPWT